MLNQNINFEFIGFDPEYETKSIIISVADRLHSLAPSDSFMKVAVKKSTNAVEASCRIASQAGEFKAESVSSNPVTAIRQVEIKIKQQLDVWKKHRFLENNREIKSSRPHLELAN